MAAEHVVRLNAQAHRDLRLNAGQPYHFAARHMTCPVVSREITSVAREYAVLFPQAADAPPLALLGLEKDRNGHVTPTGHWLGRYVPAHLGAYPFSMGAVDGTAGEGQQSFAVLIDEAAPHLDRRDGQPLFGDDGQPTATLDRIKRVLAALEADRQATTDMVRQLDAQGLLKKTNLVIRQRDGVERAVSGFRVIDTARLLALDGAALAALQKTGALMLAYAHLVSLANLQHGVLAQGAPAPAAKAMPSNLDSVFSADNGAFDFSGLKPGPFPSTNN